MAKDMTKKKIIIVGGGISGLLATIKVCEAGGEVDSSVPTAIIPEYGGAVVEVVAVRVVVEDGEVPSAAIPPYGTIEVVSGCKGCQTLHQNVIDALAEMNVAADVQYITDMQKIMETGVMGLPALAVNDKIVSAGKVLSVTDIKKFLG